MTDRIDEMTNEDLARRGHSDHILRDELDRVESVLRRHAMIGSDTSYFAERSRILRQLIGGGCRAIGL